MKLLPVSDLDRGFIRPEYPDQVIVSYFQAGRICDFIQERWGADKLLGMVHSYAQLKTTPEVYSGELGHGAEGVHTGSFRFGCTKTSALPPQPLSSGALG